MFYKKSNAVPGPGSGFTGFVLTEQVREGYFWFIPYIHFADFNSNGQFVALFLVPPDFYNLCTLPSILVNGFPQPIPNQEILLVPNSGQSPTGIGGSFAATRGYAVCPFLTNYIIVPSLYGLLLSEQNNFAPGSPMEIRFLYRQIRNECMPQLFEAEREGYNP